MGPRAPTDPSRFLNPRATNGSRPQEVWAHRLRMFVGTCRSLSRLCRPPSPSPAPGARSTDAAPSTPTPPSPPLVVRGTTVLVSIPAGLGSRDDGLDGPRKTRPDTLPSVVRCQDDTRTEVVSPPVSHVGSDDEWYCESTEGLIPCPLLRWSTLPVTTVLHLQFILKWSVSSRVTPGSHLCVRVSGVPSQVKTPRLSRRPTRPGHVPSRPNRRRPTPRSLGESRLVSSRFFSGGSDGWTVWGCAPGGRRERVGLFSSRLAA